MKVSSNADRLVTQVLSGEVWPATADRHAYRVDADGTPFVLPGMGAVTLGTHLGDPATGLRADFARNEEVPFLDVVATYDAKQKQVAVFALNRDIGNERELALTFEDIAPSKVLAAETITGPDLKAFNTFESPNKVVSTRLDVARAGAKMSVKLPARSYTVVHLAV